MDIGYQVLGIALVRFVDQGDLHAADIYSDLPCWLSKDGFRV